MSRAHFGQRKAHHRVLRRADGRQLARHGRRDAAQHAEGMRDKHHRDIRLHLGDTGRRRHGRHHRHLPQGTGRRPHQRQAARRGKHTRQRQAVCRHTLPAPRRHRQRLRTGQHGLCQGHRGRRQPIPRAARTGERTPQGGLGHQRARRAGSEDAPELLRQQYEVRRKRGTGRSRHATLLGRTGRIHAHAQRGRSHPL